MNNLPALKTIVIPLLTWFGENARDLPWRRTLAPYAIWVSEIMLQQTQVKTVIPYWQRWMTEYPTVEALASSSSEKVHKLWEGLGYYTRARNLQKGAIVVTERFHGQFPCAFDDVLSLPGIGRYTAGAICSIAYNQATPIVDGNVIRVLSRVFGLRDNPKSPPGIAQIWALAAQLVECAHRLKPDAIPLPSPVARMTAGHCSRLNQSLMELGAVICTPRQPGCPDCPLKTLCVARRENLVEQLPVKVNRPATLQKRFLVFIVKHRQRFLVCQRPDGGVNAQLWEFANIEAPALNAPIETLASARLGIGIKSVTAIGKVQHSITHHRITAEVYWVTTAALPRPSLHNHLWASREEIDCLPMTAAHRKIWKTIVAPLLKTL